MMKAFGVLAKMRKYRGTALDVFGRTDERRKERALIVEYEKTVDEILGKLAPHNHATAVEIASIPEHIRGYGHVKDAHLATAKTREAALLAAFRTPTAAPKPAVVKVVV
jgi:indolepyruvate ferredoxin oxidoreductase